uniref:Murine leukemia virus integrase C-terminal domain-containing protein n=1 Tax=Knipowitschia caucasica TaxID=637954 RepID=A0AAV2LD86_KNICA
MTLFVDGSCYRDGAALKAGYAISQTKEEEVPPAVKPGDLVYVKTFRRKWHTPRREGPYEVVNATSTAVQVKGSPTWYHLNHCVKAPADGNEVKTIKEKEKNDHGCQGDESLEGGDEDPRGAGNDNDSTAEFPDVILVEGTGTPTGRET